MNVVFLGAGVMSSALAICLNGQHSVSIVPTPFDQSTVTNLREKGFDSRLDVKWPDIPFGLPFNHVDLVIIGVSSPGIGWALQEAEKILVKNHCPIVLLTKGLALDEGGSLLTLLQLFESSLKVPVLSISGPCIAKSLAHKHQTKVVLSCQEIALAQKYAKLLGNDYYHVEPSSDAIGAAWMGALKNVYAICVGQAGENLNLRSALFSQAVKEMAMWCAHHGGDPATVYGLSGVGDLYVTCQGGRNGQLGHYLSQGLSVDEILNGPMKNVTVEGLDLARKLSSQSINLSLPLYEGLLQAIKR